MITIKYSILFLVGLTTIHLINLVGGFLFASNEQQSELSSSAEIIDAFRASLTTTTSTMKAEQFMLEQRLADVRFHFNSLRKKRESEGD